MRDLTFRQYQVEANRTDNVRGEGLKPLMVPLLGLSGEVGGLLSEYKKMLRDGSQYHQFDHQVAEEIGDILWYLANLAEKAGLDLEDVANENLEKIRDRWGDRHDLRGDARLPIGRHRFDDEFPPDEQLPHKLRLEFRREMIAGVEKVVIRRDGVPVGDPLTDNAYADDGYSFHDVFHFTFAIVLGWSPLVRKLLACKRSSDKRIDEVEDGARALFTEEALSIFTFVRARDYSFFDGVDAVNHELLKQVRAMTCGLEVNRLPLADWENAILQAYSVWRPMLREMGGVFVGDSAEGRVRIESLPPESASPA